MAGPIDRLGGRERLEGVIRDFYDRVFADVMIGFLFRNASKERLIEKETELMAAHFGAEETYTGRPIREAHERHRIMGGQFDRRLQILKETLEDHNVPREVRDAWIAHTLSLRDQVTRDREGECRP